MYGANGSFMKLRLLLFRRVFPFAYKNALPTLNAFPARLPGGISHVRFDPLEERSILDRRRYAGTAWKEMKCGKDKVENVESPSSEPQPFDTAVNLRLLWLLLVINYYLYYYNEIARGQLEAYFIEKRKEGEKERKRSKEAMPRLKVQIVEAIICYKVIILKWIDEKR